MSLQVINPFGTNYPDGSNLVNNLSGRQGEQLGADLHGKWYNANLRRDLFSFVIEGVGVQNIFSTVATNGVVAVCMLQNPTSSGVNAEIVSTTMGHGGGTTIVTGFGWYTANAAAVSGPANTKGVAGTNYFSSRVGDTPNGQVIPFSSFTFSSGLTSALTIFTKVDAISNVGGTTDTTFGVADKQHEGRLILPPGQVLVLGASPAASASSNIQVVWAEWPFA